ncbi:MAG: DUF4011 domain-containing protein [Bacteroidaceae bacterium]|nr:DUF4011 domain-containing protein [Bacteroidaceae bacterium]
MDSNNHLTTNHNIALELDYLEEVNYALIHSKLDICNWCIIENNSDADMNGIHMEISGEYIETYSSMPFAIDAKQRIRLQDINLQVISSKLLSLTERVSSHIKVRVLRGSEVLREQCYPIIFMAYNQWHGTECYPQLLASFITPNHPCIASVVKRASEHLYRINDSKSFNGYCSESKERVREQVEAIYLALQEEELTYNLSVRSYEETGQRIRLASEVMTDKLGNCMDLTLLFAACLEYIGLNTILILEHTHIYLGVWLIPDSHVRSADDDNTFLLKKTSEGIDDILVIESTYLSKAEKRPIELAIEAATETLNRKHNLNLFIDVYRCRLEGYLPLPQIVKRDDMWVLSENAESNTNDGMPPMPLTQQERTDTAKPTKQLLWERKLLDFTKRNTLLNVNMSSAIQLMSVSLKDVASKMFESSCGFRIDEAPSSLDILPSLDGGTDNSIIIDSAQMGMDTIKLVKDDIKSGRLHSYFDDKITTNKLKKLRRMARTMMEENGAPSLYMSIGLMQWSDDTGTPLLAPILLLPIEFVYKNQVYHVKWRGEDPMLNVTLFEYLKQTYEIEFDGLEELVNSDNSFDLLQIFAIIREGLLKKPHWNVLEECLIGVFSFNKFVMWNDIHTHGTQMQESPIIDALVENDLILTEEETPTDLDASLAPSDLCTPLPFDSSQLQAIVASTGGKSFILHGPPGTGKSQTIANMITNALYHGKRVLFVAEKMAALSVVQNRLEKLGLGDFCLELHSNKATKRHFVQQLASVIEHIEKEGEQGKHLAMAQQLHEQRQELMKHVNALHSREAEDQFSIYESIMHYSRFSEEGMVDLHDATRPTITPQNLTDYEYYIDRLGAIIRLIGQPSQHPLLGVTPNAQTMAHFAELRPAIDECLTHIRQLQHVVNNLAQLTDGIPPISLGSIHTLMTQVKEVHLLREHIMQSASPEIFSAAIPTFEQKRASLHQTKPLARFFKKWSLLREVKHHHAHVTWATLEEFIQSLAHLNANPVHRQLSIKADLASILATNEGYESAFAKLTSWLAIDGWQLLSIRELEGRLEHWAQHLDKLKDWKQWCLIKEDLYQKDMGAIAHLMETEEVTLPQLKHRYLARYFYELANKQIASNPEADMFNGMLFDEKVSRYKELAHRYQDLSRDELLNRLLDRARAASINSSWSNQSVLLHKVISNGGRGLTIRRLFQQAPDVLTHFCPCLLMSPMSVSQYLEMQPQMFDLVIFDEASQIPTNEAVGAIARGKTIIIVGDTRQMPPTSFFVSNKTTDEEFGVDDLESILDDCQALKMPSLLLSWHYRSKHESLICFSNNEYYENKLHTFPAIDDQERRVTYVPVKGTYQKGGSRSNKAEALAIVNEIERRLSDEQLRLQSIGVISFNVQQQYLIEDLLEERFEKSRQLRLWAEESGEPIFIKNLENVQGDERDVILFSVGYGPDKEGKISMNFGPLNLVGGERRLNVAVTRSRYEMMVFSSLHARDIDLRRTNAKGVEGLHRFLDYAEHGTLIKNLHSGEEPMNEKVITLQIARRLEAEGLKVKTFVGNSKFKVNIAIADPHDERRYLLGILLDDKLYHAIPTMSDREIVQPSVLQSLGWNVKRVWTLDWFDRPEHVIDNILSELNTPQQ